MNTYIHTCIDTYIHIHTFPGMCTQKHKDSSRIFGHMIRRPVEGQVRRVNWVHYSSIIRGGLRKTLGEIMRYNLELNLKISFM